MKILQVIPELSLAGAEIMLENLATSLSARGHDITVVSFYSMETPITRRLVKQNFDVIFLDKNSGFDLKLIIKLRKIIKEINPDIIHTHRYVLPYVYISNFGINKKIVHTVHNIAKKEVGRKQQILQYFLFRKRNIVPVAISPIVRETIIDLYKIKNVPMVYNGINIETCKSKQQYDISDGGIILHVGRFSEQKNHRMLIEAFAKVQKVKKNVKLLLIGQGELESEIRKIVQNLEVTEKVVFAGVRENVKDVMSIADIFVLSSFYEGMPMTIIEAMACGLPIVATRVGGVPDMICNGEDGVLVGVNASELADALIELLDNKELRERYGKAAFNNASKFSSFNMAEEYEDIYISLG